MLKLRGLEGNLPKMALVRLLCWMHWMSAVIVPFFRDWGRLTFTQIFALQAWFMVACFLLEVPTGTVADRFGRRVSVALGGLLLGLATLVYGSLPRLEVFALGETLFAVALTLISGADEALVYDSLKALGREADASHVMARLEAFKLGGVFAGALLGSLAAARWGVRAPMLIQAVPLALSGLAALSLVEPPRGETSRMQRPSYLGLLSGGLEHLRADRDLRALALDQVACVTVSWLLLWLYQPQLTRAGVPIGAFGVVHAAMGLGQILLLSRVASFERAAGGRVRLVRLTGVVPALAMLGLAASRSPVVSIVLILVAGIAGMGRPPLFSGAVNARIPSERRATVLSAVSAARTLATALLYPAVGAIVDRSLPAALGCLGGLGLAVALLAAAPARLLEAPAHEPSAPLSSAAASE